MGKKKSRKSLMPQKTQKLLMVQKSQKMRKSEKTKKRAGEKEMLYLECSSGISGDMAVAALLDLGADETAVREALASLPVQGFSIEISRVVKSGLDVCDFNVRLDAAHENHDHDMAYLHGADWQRKDDDGEEPVHHVHHGEFVHGEFDHDESGNEHDALCESGSSDRSAYQHQHQNQHEHAHEHTHEHELEHEYEHEHEQEHKHEHRNLADVTAIIESATMTPRAKEIACRIFEIIAQAEAKAHGRSLDEVHFHEVGAIDSIADIVAFSVALDSLQVDDVVVTALSEGQGSIRCQHGLIPVPAPAVVNIVAANGIPLTILPIQGELVTPTGAAIVAAVRTRTKLPKQFLIERVGMGNGKRVYETPGILRALLIRSLVRL